MDSRYIMLTRGLGARRGLGDASTDSYTIIASDPNTGTLARNDATGGVVPLTYNDSFTVGSSWQGSTLGIMPVASSSGVTSTTTSGGPSYTPQIASTTNQVVASTGQVLSSILPSILGPSTTTGGLALRPANPVMAPQSSFPWGTVLLVGGAGLLVYTLSRRKGY
jgi:hypothetical protein